MNLRFTAKALSSAHKSSTASVPAQVSSIASGLPPPLPQPSPYPHTWLLSAYRTPVTPVDSQEKFPYTGPLCATRDLCILPPPWEGWSRGAFSTLYPNEQCSVNWIAKLGRNPMLWCVLWSLHSASCHVNAADVGAQDPACRAV